MAEFSVNGPDSVVKSVLFVVVALALVGYGGYDYVQQTDAVENAVEVEATIVEVGVERTTSPGGSADVEFEPTVRYEYSFEGTAYTGTEVFPGSVTPEYETESAARDVVSAYEPNTTATAYVDPSDPDDAFLENRVSNTPLLLVGIGLVLALLGSVATLRNLG
ncbi:DUF3592 domain-containing protein [Haloglomus litoreum]|uniref:DUF3592 domain-containing protein n=1 Tax=Haloglomus litoreum TaxID=3034026 RepID=UPI0023E82EFF|nr:DUF3592 domain-containing protein [Haloglomus sp. DT116]